MKGGWGSKRTLGCDSWRMGEGTGSGLWALPAIFVPSQQGDGTSHRLAFIDGRKGLQALNAGLGPCPGSGGP